MRTSASTTRVDPSGVNRRSCRKRSSFACSSGRHVADLVEEQRAAVGQLDEADLAALRGRVGALLVAEQLALDQLARDRRAVDGDEACPVRPLCAWIGVREHLLADAGFTDEQDLRVGCARGGRSFGAGRPPGWASRSAAARTAPPRPRCIASSSTCVTMRNTSHLRAQEQHRAVVQRHRPVRALAVDVGAVRALQILDDEQVGAAGRALDAGVQARDGRVRDRERRGPGLVGVGAGVGCGPAADVERQLLHGDDARRAQGVQRSRRCRSTISAPRRGTSADRPRRGTVRLISFSSLAGHRDAGRTAPPGLNIYQPGPSTGRIRNARRSRVSYVAPCRRAVRGAQRDALARGRRRWRRGRSAGRCRAGPGSCRSRTPLRRGGWSAAARRAARAPRRRCDPRARTGRRRAPCAARASPRSTMSASEPTAIVPLRGYMPNRRAALVDVSATNRSGDSRPVTTPSV